MQADNEEKLDALYGKTLVAWSHFISFFRCYLVFLSCSFSLSWKQVHHLHLLFSREPCIMKNRNHKNSSLKNLQSFAHLKPSSIDIGYCNVDMMQERPFVIQSLASSMMCLDGIQFLVMHDRTFYMTETFHPSVASFSFLFWFFDKAQFKPEIKAALLSKAISFFTWNTGA